MNEKKLIELWKSGDAKDSPTINFEQIQKNRNIWRKKLRRKIKLDILASAVFYIALVPICFVLPKLIYFLPVIALMSVLGYRELWRIYKQETKTEEHKSIKEFLQKKNLIITNYVRGTRIILYSTIPLFVLASFLVQVTFEWILDHLIRVFLILVISEVFAIIFNELYLKIMYLPSIKESKELLKQLESEE